MDSRPSSLAPETKQEDLEVIQTQVQETDEQRENRVKAVIAALNFDRGALRASKADLVPAIENAKKALAEIQSNPALASYATELAKQIGIYYGYHLRNSDLAIQYFEIFKQLAVPGSLDQVRANMYIGYAGTIRGSYNNREFFDEALRDLAVYEKKLADATQLTPERLIEINVDKGYIECFLGLVIHRKSYQTPGITELERIATLDHAIQHLKSGQAFQQAALDATENSAEYDDLHTQILIELPNTHHIESICHAKIPRRFEEVAALDKALLLEMKYQVKTKKDHFLLYVSRQNHALTWGLYLGKPTESLVQIKDVLKCQQEFFKDAATGEPTDNLDIAKTHHFMGQILAKLGKYEEAILSFQTAFDMKLRLGVPMLAFDMIDTQTCMLNAVSDLRISGVDNVNNVALMLKTVNKVLKLDWNLHHLFEGFKSLMKPLVPVVDFLLQYLPSHAPELMPQLLPKLYELGAYYNHLKRSQPYNAFDYLNPALEYCDANKNKVDTELHHWIINHIAFTYHQELAQSSGKDISVLRQRYVRYAKQSADNLNAKQIRDYFYEKSMEAADRTIRFVSDNSLVQNRIRAFGHLVSAYNKYERQRYMSEPADKIRELADVVAQCGVAIQLYVEKQDFQEQYLRANNRYADLISEYVALLVFDPKHDKAIIAALPKPLDLYEANKAKRKELKTEAGNPFAGRGYFSEAKYLVTKVFIADAKHPDYLSPANTTCLQNAVAAYSKAYEILAVSEGPEDGFTKDALGEQRRLQGKLAEMIALSQQQYDEAQSLTAEQKSQTLNTGSTTAEAGMFAGSASEAERQKLAAALAAAQQAQSTTPTLSQ